MLPGDLLIGNSGERCADGAEWDYDKERWNGKSNRRSHTCSHSGPGGGSERVVGKPLKSAGFFRITL